MHRNPGEGVRLRALHFVGCFLSTEVNKALSCNPFSLI